MKRFVFSAALLMQATFLASATNINYAGADLSGLTYLGNPSTDAAFVTGSPDYANLFTANAGLGGDTPKASVNGPLGTLSAFTASYVVLSQTGGGAGNSGYWDLLVSDPNNAANMVELIAFSGTTLNSSTLMHTPSGLFSFGTAMSSVYGLTDGSTTLGNWIVDSAGVEIGNFGNTEGSMDLELASISINDSLPSVPETTPTWLLLGLAMGGLLAWGRWHGRSPATK